MKVTTLSFIHRGKEEIRFTYDVNVTKDGTFSTTLPKEAVSKIEAYGVTLNENRVGNRGYFSSDTMEGLERKIREAVEEAVSCELVSTEDVIKYQIMICASYCRKRDDQPRCIPPQPFRHRHRSGGGIRSPRAKTNRYGHGTATNRL